MLTDFLRAFMPVDNAFPTHRTTAAVLDLMHSADTALTPEQIHFCAGSTKRLHNTEGVRECKEPTVYYGTNSERPNCAGCTNLRSSRLLNSSMLRLRIADWIQVIAKHPHVHVIVCSWLTHEQSVICAALNMRSCSLAPTRDWR